MFDGISEAPRVPSLCHGVAKRNLSILFELFRGANLVGYARAASIRYPHSFHEICERCQFSRASQCDVGLSRRRLQLAVPRKCRAKASARVFKDLCFSREGCNGSDWTLGTDCHRCLRSPTAVQPGSSQPSRVPAPHPVPFMHTRARALLASHNAAQVGRVEAPPGGEGH